MPLMEGGYFKMTWKTRILLWVYRHWPRVDQWAIKHCDMMPPDYNPFKEHRSSSEKVKEDEA